MDFASDMTVEEALRVGAQRLSGSMAKAEARREAGYLLTAVLGCDRAVLLTGERALTASERRGYEQGLAHRADGKPLALICGEKEFYGLPFACGSSLIPRPDSEALVELACEHLPSGELRILDLGCGSGCLGISVALQCEVPPQLVLADADRDALACAEQNAKRHLGAGTTTLFSNWFSQVEGSFDIILCNPPYVEADDLPYLPRGVRHYEPTQALCFGASGLQAYELLAEQVSDYLLADGFLVVEIGSGQGEAVQNIFTANGLHYVCDKYDLGGVRRALLFRRQA